LHLIFLVLVVVFAADCSMLQTLEVSLQVASPAIPGINVAAAKQKASIDAAKGINEDLKGVKEQKNKAKE
jgi:hypothetical protein